VAWPRGCEAPATSESAKEGVVGGASTARGLGWQDWTHTTEHIASSPRPTHRTFWLNCMIRLLVCSGGHPSRFYDSRRTASRRALRVKSDFGADFTAFEMGGHLLFGQ
jgi:hypothetical protein